MQPKIYFDITDIVEYAISNSWVSGIQRVQARVISAMAEAKGGDIIRCVFRHPGDGAVYEVSAYDIFADKAFNSIRLLFLLGLVSDSYIPQKFEVKRYLQKYNHRKLYRGLKKVQIYTLAVLAPKQLDCIGFSRFKKNNEAAPLALTKISELQHTDVFMFLGANWSYPEMLAFGKRHKSNGGIVVQMIYDLIPFYGKKYCKDGLVGDFDGFIRNTTSYATKFTAISEWTKRDFVSFLSTECHTESSVTTVPLAHEFDGYARNTKGTAPDDAHIAKTLQNQPFILCVGSIEVRKNGIALLEAWSKLLQTPAEKVPKLVFAGKYGWKISNFLKKLEENSALKDAVHIFSTPSDKDLAYLYENCLCCAYPSHYEGWGLPVGEAAWFGKYTIASSATSLPEVCGDLIDYVGPDDIDGWVVAIRKIMNEPKYLQAKELAIQHAPLRSWREVATNLYQCLK
jgi:glycosyltransferase involved in cell wall biosynthesis